MPSDRVLRFPWRVALLGCLATLVLATVAPAARAHVAHSVQVASRPGLEVVLDWYDITDQTVTAADYPEPVTQTRAWAVSWLAAARAVNGSRNRSFATAALAQALHDTLVAQVPSQQFPLDADLASTLSLLPDGRAKRAGIKAGEREAALILAQRARDGLDTTSVDVPFTPPPPAPGVWQPTPPSFGPAIRAGEGRGTPFLLRRNNQFQPGPPPALDSRTYLDALAEVHAYGQDTSTVRTPEQTDVARFWEVSATNVVYAPVLRQVIEQNPQRSLAWDARFVAAFHAITTDAQIAIYYAKYTYVFWRPVTAIRTGSVDQNPNWTSFFASPRHPEYPGGHSGYAGAAQEVLSAFVGRRPAEPVTVESPTDPGIPHTWKSWLQITRETVNARVWEGVHFRFSDNTGARVGANVADYDIRHLNRLGI